MKIITTVTVVTGKGNQTVCYSPGECIDLAQGEAQRLIALGFAQAQAQTQAQTALQGAELIEAIVDVIADLKPKDLGKDGKPHVKAIEQVIGQNITAGDRDRAWEAYQQLMDES